MPSQIHVLLAHTVHKHLRLIETIQNILKSTQTSWILGEKQKLQTPQNFLFSQEVILANYFANSNNQ